MRHCLALAIVAAMAVGAAKAAEGPVRIGVLNDQSSVYSVDAGKEVVEAVNMAVEDSGPVLGQSVQVISADHQNKADVASAIARRWYSEGIDVILDVPNSSAAFAVQSLATENKKLALFVGALSSDLTGSRCSPYTAQWSMDSWSLSKVVGSALLKQGKTKWFFLGVDYTFGRTLVDDTSRVIRSGGGQVLGAVYAPLGSTDYTSYLLQAQASGAQVVGLANTVTDAMNTYKQGVEFGMTASGQSFAVFVFTISNVKSLTLDQAHGLLVPGSFYWNMNDATRAFSARFSKRVGHPPDWPTAMAYSAAYHYLKAVKQVGAKQAETVIAEMRKLPVDDPTTHNAVLRSDGRVAREMYLFRVKTPATSQGPWDLYDVVETVSPENATRPLSEGGCKLSSQ